MNRIDILLLIIVLVVTALVMRVMYPNFSLQTIKCIANMKRAVWWGGDVLITVFPHGNFLLDDTYVSAHQMFNHFFKKEKASHLLEVHFPQGRLLLRRLEEGESFCALKPRRLVPDHVTERGTLCLVHEDKVVHSWNVLHNPKRPTITKTRAIVFVEGTTTSLQGTLYVRGGPKVELRFIREVYPEAEYA